MTSIKLSDRILSSKLELTEKYELILGLVNLILRSKAADSVLFLKERLSIEVGVGELDD